MSTYMIVQARITDPERFKDYTALVPALVARFGGQYLILAGHTEVLEGDWPQVKTVVSQWPDRSAAKAFWDSPEYRHACSLREGAGEFTVVLIDGLGAALTPTAKAVP